MNVRCGERLKGGDETVIDGKCSNRRELYSEMIIHTRNVMIKIKILY